MVTRKHIACSVGVLLLAGIVVIILALRARRISYDKSLDAVIKHGGHLHPDKRPLMLARRIDLSHADIDDDAIEEFEGLTYGPEFELDLSFTRVSDRSVQTIARIRAWKLVVVGTQITSSGVKTLQRAKPDLQVEWKPLISDSNGTQ
jgi:hypothetical protein